jgi:putative transcriptional regulator
MATLAGKLLVARPLLRDGFFGQAVVLLLQHGPEGAFGLVLNRPAKIEDSPLPVCLGGPCKFDGFLLLHGHREWLKDQKHPEGQVIPGVYLGDAAIMERVSNALPGANVRFRLFAGYSGWGGNQLENELGEGAWSIVNAESSHVFDVPPDELWEQVAPPTIPEPSLN